MIIKAIKETLGQMFYSPEATGSWVIEEEDIECAIDDQIVDCSKVDSTPYIGVPAPAYLEDDEWFGPAFKSEKQMTHEEMLEEAERREEENRQEQTIEPDNIHQVMYEMATKNSATTLQLDPIGGSENFQGGSENVQR